MENTRLKESQRKDLKQPEEKDLDTDDPEGDDNENGHNKVCMVSCYSSMKYNQGFFFKESLIKFGDQESF